MLAGEVRIKGREVQNGDKKTLATLTPNGTTALSIEGARRLGPMGVHLVEIGEFLPKGDVLSPGIIDADEEIRPGDDVIYRGEEGLRCGTGQDEWVGDGAVHQAGSGAEGSRRGLSERAPTLAGDRLLLWIWIEQSSARR